jgi:hypothetical protein
VYSRRGLDFCRREISLAPVVIRTPDGPACSLDTVPTFNNTENGMAYVKRVSNIKHIYRVSMCRLLKKRTHLRSINI